jgi:hypothetical protein
MFLFVDDERNPEYLPNLAEIIREYGEPVVARTVDECFDFTTDKVVTFISFDHDLGLWPDGSAMESPQFLNVFLEAYLTAGTKIPEYQIHSSNPPGRDSIRSKMETAKKVQALGW